MQSYTTSEQGILEHAELRFREDDAAEYRLVTCHPRVTYQRVLGFGAALTEASAFVFAQMPPDLQDVRPQPGLSPGRR